MSCERLRKDMNTEDKMRLRKGKKELTGMLGAEFRKLSFTDRQCSCFVLFSIS